MHESADLFQSVERVGIQAIIPAYLAKPAKPAKPGQAGQPARPAGHRSLRPPGIDVSNLLSIRVLGVPQAATRGIAFWHPQHQGEQPSMPQTHQISMIWPPFQQIESWHDHFMDLGYPSKFYRVQDAIFIDGSSI